LEPFLENLRPRGAFAWGLAALGVVALLAVLVVAFFMLWLVDYDGVGKLGVYGLMFAPQLFALTIPAGLCAWLSYRRGAMLATFAFALVVALTAAMAAWPTVSQRLRAGRYGASVSMSSAVVPKFMSRKSGATVTYATSSDGKKLLLDVWRARGVPAGTLRPAIVFVHGGGWNHGSRGEAAAWNEFLNGLGYDVFDVDYRLPPPERWLDEVGDVKCALGWVLANASKYSLEPSRISVMGYSAGAHLAMLAAYSMGNPLLPASCPAGPVAIRSVINFYGPTDLEKLYESTGSPRHVHAMLHAFIGGSPERHSGRYDLLSPTSHVKRRTPPTITLQGEADRVVPVEQAALLEEAFEEKGALLETYLFPFADHGFDFVWSSLSAQTARETIRVFLGKHG
jgi:acetyl esterase/lipase